MKVLSVIETLGLGGAERVLVSTLVELRSQGVDCEVAILFDIDDLANELETLGIKVHRLSLSHRWNIAQGFFRLNRLIKSHAFDVIHAHLFFAYFYTGLVGKLNPKIKTVTTFHNLGYTTYPAKTCFKKIRKKIDSFVVNALIDNKVGVSNMVRNHYADHLSIPKVDVIFNAFPLAVINKFIDAEDGDVLKRYVDASLFDFYSITPGRLVREKGHVYLIESLEKLSKKLPNIFHFIVGSGPLEKEIRATLKRKNLVNVKLIKGLPQKDLFALILACDLVVVPSISEGFPMVVGEAMCLGKPVIATKISGIVDMIEDGCDEGVLVPPHDVDSLTNAIEELYSNENYRLIIAQNSRKKIAKFDIKIITKEWIEYYERMLS